MGMQWKRSLGVLKDWEDEPLAFCPVLTNLTALSTLTGRILHSYHWLHQFDDFLQIWNLFTCLFWRVNTPCYLNWKGAKEKQDKPHSLKALLNPIHCCPAIFSLGFLFQWSTSLFKRAPIHGVQAVLISCWLCGHFLKSRTICMGVSPGPFQPWNM